MNPLEVQRINMRPYGLYRLFPLNLLNLFKLLALLNLLALVCLIGACAPRVVEKKVWDITWPLPPDEPKIKYVGILQSNLDVEERGGLGSFLFGEERDASIVKPYGVAVDKEGRVFVTDLGWVFVFDKKNKKLSRIGYEPGNGKLASPAGIAVSGVDGRIYVTDVGEKKVFMYDRTGRFLTTFGREGELQNPVGVAVDDKRQKVYVVDSKKRMVRVYSTSGQFIMSIDKTQEGLNFFHTPTQVALDSAGDIYVSDMQGFSVKVFEPDGSLKNIIGGLGDSPGTFSRPKGVAIDSEDHLYVVDAAFNNFQIFDKDGQLLLFVGSGGSNPGQFNLPAGMAIDEDDKIYVAEQYNSRVQIFQYLSEKWKKSHPEEAQKLMKGISVAPPAPPRPEESPKK